MSCVLKKYMRLVQWKRFLSTVPSVSETSTSDSKLEFAHLKNGSTLLSQMMLKVQSKKVREKSGIAVLEGRRLIGDALSAGLQFESIFFSRKQDLKEFINLIGKAQLYRLPYNDITSWSTVETSPGLIAFARISQCKAVSSLWKHSNALPVVVICDQIRDPGNLGALLRTSAAAGISKVILMKGTTDAWDSKVLRGGCGAHFKIDLETNASWDDVTARLGPHDTVLLAVNNPDSSKPYWDIPLQFSNNNSRTENSNSRDKHQKGKIYLVVGSESQGLSQDCFQYLPPSIISKVHIPLERNVESLNSTVAISVILFDIKRRFAEYNSSCG